MSYFFGKIKQNRSSIIAAACGLTVGYLLYRIVKQQPKPINTQQQRKQQIQLLRKQINSSNPTFEDIKKVMSYSINQAKIKVIKFQEQFKQKRMRYTKQTRKQYYKQYLNLVYQGMEEMELIAVKQQINLFKQLGIDQLHFKKYQKLLEKSLDQILHVQNKNISHIKPMKLEDAKFAFRKQIEFVKEEGLHYAQLIIDATKNWPKQQKATIPSLLEIIITDGAFEGYPQFDVNSIEHAQKLYEKQLMGELQQLQIQMAPMMIKLSNSIKQVSGYDLTDFKHEADRMDYQQIGKLRDFQKNRLQEVSIPYK